VLTEGRFITLEGGEGAGKSTQAARLTQALARQGLDVVLTREPGGSPNAERIRALLLAPSEVPWPALSEALLHFAARAEHLTFTIEPAVRRGAWVVCDRFTDSTRAYQGYGQGLSLAVIDRLDAVVCQGRKPDLTIILDLPVEEGLARARHRDGATASRYEALGLEFHRHLRDGFHAIAAREPDRCVLIDGQGEPGAVHAAIMNALERRLGLPNG